MRILHWLEISNFKGYRSSGRIPLEHPSVLIGPNNCGKTTALQAIALWSTAVRSWQQNAKDSKAKTRTGKPLNRLAIQAVPVPKTRQFWKNLKVSGHELQISLGLELEGAVVPVTMVFRHHASDVPVMPWCWSTCRSPQQRDVPPRLPSGSWSIVTTPTSVLFLAHGSPMFALEPGAAGAALAELATGLERPRAVLVISPHWETEVPTVGTASQLPTIHDFGGFDPALYALHYPASGSPQGAQEVVAALSATGLPVSTDPERGLDHGAWVPLRYLFPAAEVPVVPLSIQHHGGPEHAYHVGQALAPLAEQGWLIVASGNITHNLRDWQQARLGGGVDTRYVQRFSDWVAEQLSAGQVEALLHARQQHPDALRAHPRDEHLLPLFTALGAAGPEARALAIHRGISDHVLAMDSYAFEWVA